MTWDDLEEALHEELRRLPPGPPSGHGISWERSNWALREEHTHQEALTRAFEHRISCGRWPESLTPVQAFLVSLRLHALRRHVAVLSAWGAPEAPSMEAVLERVAVQQWPKLRWREHLLASVLLPVNETDDPFEEGAPPRWLDG